MPSLANRAQHEVAVERELQQVMLQVWENQRRPAPRQKTYPACPVRADHGEHTPYDENGLSRATHLIIRHDISNCAVSDILLSDENLVSSGTLTPRFVSVVPPAVLLAIPQYARLDRSRGAALFRSLASRQRASRRITVAAYHAQRRVDVARVGLECLRGSASSPSAGNPAPGLTHLIGDERPRRRGRGRGGLVVRLPHGGACEGLAELRCGREVTEPEDGTAWGRPGDGARVPGAAPRSAR